MISPVQTGDVHVHRAILKYEIFGAGAPAIVLHGGPGVGYHYLLPELVDSLCGCARLICYDQRASGLSTGSDAPELLTISNFVADLRQVYASLNISSAILLGHSFGGLLAMQFSLRYPELVAGLILVDSDPPSKLLWNRYTERLRPQPEQDVIELAEIRGSEAWHTDPSRVARYFELVLKPFFFADEKMPRDFGKRFALVPPENLFGTAPLVRASLGDWDLDAELIKLNCPVQIIAGDKSIYPEEAVTKLRGSLPDSMLITLAEVSHFPSIEATELFRDAAAHFIRHVKRHKSLPVSRR